MTKPGYAALLLLALVCGCRPELSVVKGISAKPAKYQGGGFSGTGTLWGHTLSDLGARSVFPTATMPDERVISFVDSDKRYDVVISGPEAGRGLLLGELLAKTFGVTARRDVREIHVLVLVRSDQTSLRLAAPQKSSRPDVKTWPVYMCWYGLSALFPAPKQRTTHTFTSMRMVQLAAWLEETSEKVVLDETGLPGKYDFVLVEDPRTGTTIKGSLESVGLELRPARRKVAAIYVDTTGSPTPVRVAPLRDGYRISSEPWWTTLGPTSTGSQ